MNEFLAIAFLLVIFLCVLSISAAYRNGVRDGYQNTWLPHVMKQIKDEHLRQGGKVE